LAISTKISCKWWKCIWYFGNSVSISGNTIVIGAYGVTVGNNSVQGVAYVFIQNGTGYWIQQQKLVASNGQTNDEFGYSVSISGNTIVIGAPYATVGINSYQGASYVFIQNGSNYWIQQQKLIASDGKASDFFGSSVSVLSESSAILVLIGASGKTFDGIGGRGEAYLFSYFIPIVTTQQITAEQTTVEQQTTAQQETTEQGSHNASEGIILSSSFLFSIFFLFFFWKKKQIYNKSSQSNFFFQWKNKWRFRAA